MWAYLCTVKAFLAIFFWHILSLGLIMGWLLNNGDEKTKWRRLEDHQFFFVSVDSAFLFRRRASHFDNSPTHFDLFRSFWSILASKLLLKVLTFL
jgi:hypothetical protein